jgi:tetratricopeptide (TPR) repeat protein
LDSVWVIDPYLLPVHAGLLLGLVGLARLGRRWMAAALLIAGAFLGGSNYHLASQRHHFLGWDYIHNLNLSCPRGAVVFCEGDSNTAGPFATRFAFGKRKDLSYMATVLSDYPWYRRVLQAHYPAVRWHDQSYSPAGNMAVIAGNNPARTMVVSNSYTQAWQRPGSLIPRGLVNIIKPQGQAALSVAELDANRVHPAYVTRGVFDENLHRDPLSDRLVSDNYVETRAILAQSYFDLKAWGKAEAEYLALVPLRRRSSAPWVQAGNAAHFAGQPERAFAHWQKAFEVEPDNAQVLSNLALAYFGKSDWPKAIEFAGKALAVAPDSPTALEIRDKARARLNPQDQPSGIQAANQAALQGDALGNAGQFAQALQSYQRSRELGLNNANLHRNMSAMHARLNQFEQALAAVDRALALEPGFGDAHKLRGIYLSNLGRGPEALAALRKAAQLVPQDASIAPMIQQLESALVPKSE